MNASDGAALPYLLKRVELAVRRQLDEVLEPAGLTTVQYTAMTALERHPDMTSAALARHSFVRAQTMAQLVGVLQERGLLAGRPDPASRRRILLRLTDAGERALDELREPVAAIERRMTAALDEGEVAAVRRALRAFREALEG